MYPVELHGQQVMLREFTHDDLADVLSIVGDNAVTHWLSFDSRSEDEARAMLSGILDRARQEPRAEYYLAIALPAQQAGQHAGRARLQQRERVRGLRVLAEHEHADLRSALA